ncbi:DUF4190 domain-containing protein [Streptomyces marispadix]|uniref:DUF4190 domain-containing protein n=1 Tax=Streptomyces marispadix TaxID=2922868 RepID=A0ABS9T328_9ACTN|nr:DUF4190 domain-containing protein [Streptomyces marispadix]MCH6162902.1 DUF4190 domain-containing protein [Streptomyces marispadix]
MEDDTGRPAPSGGARHDPWAPPRDGAATGRGNMDHNEEDRKRRSVAEQPTITSGQGASPGAGPPPVPPAPGAPSGPSRGAAPAGAGGAPGSGYGASPYGAPSPYGQQPQPPQQPQQPQPYVNGGAAYGYPAQAPAPQPYGYGAGPGPGGPGGYGWHAPPQPGGKAVAAMVVGILGLLAVSTCWGSFLGIFLSPVALGLGLSAKRAADRGETGGRGQAVSGFVMGIIGTVLSVLFIAFLVVMLTVYNEEFGEYDSDPGGDGSSLDARERAAVLVVSGAGTGADAVTRTTVGG